MVPPHSIVHVCAARESAMSERVATADVIEVPAAEPGLAQSEPAETELAGTELAEAELLVEEVSIDGMCGVY
jgi:mycofactocin precursor